MECRICGSYRHNTMDCTDNSVTLTNEQWEQVVAMQEDNNKLKYEIKKIKILLKKFKPILDVGPLNDIIDICNKYK